MGLEAWGRGGVAEEEEKEEEKIPLCESIGHRPLRGRCPKTSCPRAGVWIAIPVALLCLSVRPLVGLAVCWSHFYFFGQRPRRGR